MHMRYNPKLYFICIFIFYIMSHSRYNKSINRTVDKYIEIYTGGKTMNVLGMEIPDEVAAAIVARAKTEELFKEFIEELKWRWKSLTTNKYVRREIDFRRSLDQKCKIAIWIEYNSDTLKIGYAGRSQDTEKIAVAMNSYGLGIIHEKLFKHIRETYHVEFEQYYPIFYLDDNTVEFTFKTSPQLPQLISDLTGKVPDSEFQLIDEDKIRFKIL